MIRPPRPVRSFHHYPNGGLDVYELTARGPILLHGDERLAALADIVGAIRDDPQGPVAINDALDPAEHWPSTGCHCETPT